MITSYHHDMMTILGFFSRELQTLGWSNVQDTTDCSSSKWLENVTSRVGSDQH